MIAEICCGSFEDVVIAEKAGAHRVELNNAIYLGGLTPSCGTIELCAEKTNIDLIAMIRPRPGGFSYNDYEFTTMYHEARHLAKGNIKGGVFGVLDDKGQIDEKRNAILLDIFKSEGKDAVFHRAFDITKDPFRSIESLIKLGFDRVLTSGMSTSVDGGLEVLKRLHREYGKEIEILAGSGVNLDNLETIYRETGISQYHSSCRTWRDEVFSSHTEVNYSYGEKDKYEIVDMNKAINFVSKVKRIKE